MRDVISTQIVEKIIEHSGTKNKKSEMDFRVRWLGFGESQDLWLPWKELRLNPALHDYLRQNRMASIIPKVDS
jgi:predicted SprT family Zn-dependent metalloprotease